MKATNNHSTPLGLGNSSVTKQRFYAYDAYDDDDTFDS